VLHFKSAATDGRIWITQRDGARSRAQPNAEAIKDDRKSSGASAVPVRIERP
jgi:hypothetical protein